MLQAMEEKKEEKAKKSLIALSLSKPIGRLQANTAYIYKIGRLWKGFYVNDKSEQGDEKVLCGIKGINQLPENENNLKNYHLPITVQEKIFEVLYSTDDKDEKSKTPDNTVVTTNSIRHPQSSSTPIQLPTISEIFNNMASNSKEEKDLKQKTASAHGVKQSIEVATNKSIGNNESSTFIQAKIDENIQEKVQNNNTKIQPDIPLPQIQILLLKQLDEFAYRIMRELTVDLMQTISPDSINNLKKDFELLITNNTPPANTEIYARIVFLAYYVNSYKIASIFLSKLITLENEATTKDLYHQLYITLQYEQEKHTATDEDIDLFKKMIFSSLVINNIVLHFFRHDNIYFTKQAPWNNTTSGGGGGGQWYALSDSKYSKFSFDNEQNIFYRIVSFYNVDEEIIIIVYYLSRDINLLEYPYRLQEVVINENEHINQQIKLKEIDAYQKIHTSFLYGSTLAEEYVYNNDSIAITFNSPGTRTFAKFNPLINASNKIFHFLTDRPEALFTYTNTFTYYGIKIFPMTCATPTIAAWFIQLFRSFLLTRNETCKPSEEVLESLINRFRTLLHEKKIPTLFQQGENNTQGEFSFNSFKECVFRQNGEILANLNNKERTMNLDELERIYKENGINPINLFSKLAESGYIWNTILNICVFDKRLEGDGRKRGETLVNRLIEERYNLDVDCYEEAISRLFDKRFFTCGTEPGSDIQIAPDSDPLLKMRFYWYKISAGKKNPQKEPEQPFIRIKIAAPGSTTLTSDVDTTLSVYCNDMLKMKGNIDKLQWPARWKSHPEFNPSHYAPELLIQCAIIEYFNEINVEWLGITASSCRDSNVYADGFFKIIYPDNFHNPVYSEIGYPKFNRKFEMGCEQVPNKATQEFYKENKKVKQQLELSASLFHLREYYSESGTNWQMNFNFNYNEATGRKIFLANIQEVKTNINVYYEYKKANLNKINCSNYQSKAKLPANMQEEDQQIYKLHIAYADHLLEVAKISALIEEKNDAIETIKSDIRQLNTELSTKKKSCSRKRAELTQEEDSNQILEIQKEITELEAIIANKKTDITGKQDKLQSLLKEWAKYVNRLQEAQIKANLFAHEAHVNRSATYHVVGGQMGLVTTGKLDIQKRQIIMCSILEQIGMRLLHMEVYKKQGLPFGERIYRTAKYGMRVNELINLIHNILISTHKDNYLNMLQRDCQFVREVKNSTVAVHMKGEVARNLYQVWVYCYINNIIIDDTNRELVLHAATTITDQQIEDWYQSEVELWTQLAKDIVVSVYQHYYQEKQCFWGSGFFRQPVAPGVPDAAQQQVQPEAPAAVANAPQL